MKPRDLAFTALSTAVIAVCAQITVPLFAVPFTLQTFAVALALFTLGGRRGFFSVLLYVLLGVCGIPVFSGFRAGLGHIAGASGGFIFGFIFTALLYWLLSVTAKNPRFDLLYMLLGLFACYACGVLWYSLIFHGAKHKALIIPFVIPDILKLLLAKLVSGRIKGALKI